MTVESQYFKSVLNAFERALSGHGAKLPDPPTDPKLPTDPVKLKIYHRAMLAAAEEAAGVPPVGPDSYKEFFGYIELGGQRFVQQGGTISWGYGLVNRAHNGKITPEEIRAYVPPAGRENEYDAAVQRADAVSRMYKKLEAGEIPSSQERKLRARDAITPEDLGNIATTISDAASPGTRLEELGAINTHITPRVARRPSDRATTTVAGTAPVPPIAPAPEVISTAKTPPAEGQNSALEAKGPLAPIALAPVATAKVTPAAVQASVAKPVSVPVHEHASPAKAVLPPAPAPAKPQMVWMMTDAESGGMTLQPLRQAPSVPAVMEKPVAAMPAKPAHTPVQVPVTDPTLALDDEALLAFVTGAAKGVENKKPFLWAGSQDVDAQYKPLIQALQQSLVRVNGDLQGCVDGEYGEETKKAVLAIQAKYGLKKDGAAGIQTVAALQVAELGKLAETLQTGGAVTDAQLVAEIEDVKRMQDTLGALPPKVQAELSATLAAFDASGSKISLSDPEHANLYAAIQSVKPTPTQGR